MIQIDFTQCVGCGRCAWDCFPGAITMSEGQPLLSSPGNCIGCGHCIAVCPRGAVFDDTLDMTECIPAEYPVDSRNLLTMMRSRRSCRHYLDKAVPEELLTALLEAARACPTAKNLQDTRYIVVTKQIQALLDAALEGLGRVGIAQLETAAAPDERRRAENFIRWSRQRAEDRSFDPLFFHAPLLLLFIAESETARDAAGAAAYTELMAASLGLGCLYSGYFTACAAGSPEIRNLLHLEPNEQVVRCLVLGYPDIRFQRSAPRKPLDITHM